MGSRINFTSHIEIADKTAAFGALKYYGYKELTEEFIDGVAGNPMVRYIQISKPLPDEAFFAMDRILEKRPDMYFRIYGLHGLKAFDLTCLGLLKHLRHLALDIHLGERPDMLDCNKLCHISDLQSLRLNLFDLKDYSFVRSLSTEIRELGISADTMKGGVIFDCAWLSRYEKLETLYLGKKARKHIESIAQLPNLRDLTLRGIKLKNFEFLRNKKLTSLALHWCGMNDLGSLSGFTSLRRLELWRIAMLDDLSFISTLTELEELSLIDLSHIYELPDLSGVKNIRDIRLDNVPIDIQKIPDDLKRIVHR